MKLYKNRLTMAQMQCLRITCGFDLLNAAMLNAAMKNTLFAVTAEEHGALAGMVRVVGDGAFVFFICDVMVDPDYRSRGVGSALVQEAIMNIKEMLPAGMAAPVTLIAAPGRESFYERHGFSNIDSLRGSVMQIFVTGNT